MNVIHFSNKDKDNAGGQKKHKMFKNDNFFALPNIICLSTITK